LDEALGGVLPKQLYVISKIEKCGCHIRIKLLSSLSADDISGLLFCQCLPVWPVRDHGVVGVGNGQYPGTE